MNKTPHKKWWLAIIISFLCLFPTSAKADWNEPMLKFLLQDLKTFWSSEIPGFVPPKVAVYTSSYEIWGRVDNNGKANTTCGKATKTVNLGLYCPSDHTIHLNIDDLDGLVVDVARNSNMDGDSAALLVVVHEYAHGVQNFLGYNRPNPYHELQADCIAGYYFHHASSRSLKLDKNDLDEFGAALIKLGDYYYESSDHHGEGMRRLNAFMAGAQGNRQACIQADF